MDAVGPLTRTVEDCAMVLGAIAGHDPKDVYTWNTTVPEYIQALDGNIQGVTVGVVQELTCGDVIDPDVVAAVTAVISRPWTLTATP